MIDGLRYNHQFSREIDVLESAHFIKKCMQCGMCDIACATRKEMDFSPRELFLLLRSGKREDIFRSNTIWMCSTCLLCKVRCPRGIPLVDVMHDLKSLAIKLGYTDSPQAAFYQVFWKEILSLGRISESRLLTRYYLGQGWAGMKKSLGLADIGFNMVRCGRIPLKLPKRISGIKGMRALLKKAQSQISGEAKE